VRILAKLSSGFDKLLDAFVFLSAALMFFIIIGVSVDVCGRYFFGLPIIWMSEAVSYCPLFISFLTAAWLLKTDRHVSMDVVYSHLKPKSQRALNLVTSCLATLLFFVVFWYTGSATWDSFVRGSYLTTELNPPKYLILFIIPLGSLLVIIQLLRRIKGVLGQMKAAKVDKQGLMHRP